MLLYREPAAFVDGLVLRILFRNSGDLVLEGDPLPTQLLADLTIVTDHRYAIRSRISPNKTSRALVKAIDRGDSSLIAQSFEIENALPYPSKVLAFYRMLARMDLNRSWSEHLAWRRLAVELEALVNDKTSNAKRSTRDTFASSLAEGDNDVLLLFAHNSDGKIYFPDGKPLSFEEVASIHRAVAPERVIVLVTCNAGGNDGATLTLAETILANNLATTVFASRGVVNAEDIPKLLDDLRQQGHSIRNALWRFDFEQHVEYEDGSQARQG
jgi:hypothetical protein